MKNLILKALETDFFGNWFYLSYCNSRAINSIILAFRVSHGARCYSLLYSLSSLTTSLEWDDNSLMGKNLLLNTGACLLLGLMLHCLVDPFFMRD